MPQANKRWTEEEEAALREGLARCASQVPLPREVLHETAMYSSRRIRASACPACECSVTGQWTDGPATPPERQADYSALIVRTAQGQGHSRAGSTSLA